MELDIEVSKAHAILQNLIDATYSEQEGNTKVDYLGSLLVLKDQLERVDKAIDSIA